jgi:formate dehydrogenase subunit beta
MVTLAADITRLDDVDPMTPAFPMNAATIVSRLTRKPVGSIIAAVLRPCEIRAFCELVKLKQGSLEDLLIISVDCLGAFSNTDYAVFAGKHGKEVGSRFREQTLAGKASFTDGIELAGACKACEHPVAENADIQIGIYGLVSADGLLLLAQSPKGEELLTALGYEDAAVPAKRQQIIDGIITDRKAFRDEMFATTRKQIDNFDKLGTYFIDCVNCYNCRVACPVCYCRECVFVTDVFMHEPSQYLKWAHRRGAIKMPTDTLFFHLTRLAHMSTACVGCGQCSNACPNDIPLTELFRTVAHDAQRAFDYQAGKRIDEAPPLSIFCEEEFDEVVGIE